MPGSVRTRPSQLSVHSILRAKAMPGILGYLSITSTHEYILYLRRCEILSRICGGVYQCEYVDDCRQVLPLLNVYSRLGLGLDFFNHKQFLGKYDMLSNDGESYRSTQMSAADA
jgi:hypothetical protein